MGDSLTDHGLDTLGLSGEKGTTCSAFGDAAWVSTNPCWCGYYSNSQSVTMKIGSVVTTSQSSI